MIDNLKDAIAHTREVATRQRKEAEEIREFSEHVTPPNKQYGVIVKNCLECAADHEQLAAWLEELADRREADKWLSVKERLPEEETDVLVCNEKGEMIVCRGSRSTEIEGEFIWYVCDWRYGNVTHWKPLPKAPESEAENECD